MNRLFAVLLSVVLTATSATAGALSEPTIEAPVIVEETRSSSSGIVVPLILLAVVLVAVSAGSGGSGSMGGANASDAQLKSDVTQVGVTAHGLPLYQFRYIGGAQVYEGVMAQDVARVMPDAVVPFAYGFSAVDYDKLGLELRLID